MRVKCTRLRRLGIDWDDPAQRRAYNTEKMRRYRRAGLRYVRSASIFGICIGKAWQDVAAKILR